jgi:large subunit ribosomal protein L9
MKVILLKRVPKLGTVGDVRAVSDGYARNFLLPHGLAVPATDVAVAGVKKDRERSAARAEHDLVATERLAKKLDGFELVFKEKVSTAGTLFAAVTKKRIAEALEHKKFSVTEKMVDLTHPLKELGEHEVRLTFPHGLEAKITVLIEAKV